MSGEDTGEDRAVVLTDYARHWLTMAKNTATYPGQPDADDSAAVAAAALVALRHPGELLDIMASIQTAGAAGVQLPDWWTDADGPRA